VKTPKNATAIQKKCRVAGSRGRRSLTAPPTSSVKIPTAASTKYNAPGPFGIGATRTSMTSRVPSLSVV
jgi:hypothetical protein